MPQTSPSLTRPCTDCCGRLRTVPDGCGRLRMGGPMPRQCRANTVRPQDPRTCRQFVGTTWTTAHKSHVVLLRTSAEPASSSSLSCSSSCNVRAGQFSLRVFVRFCKYPITHTPKLNSKMVPT
jgi:hypothetical protein